MCQRQRRPLLLMMVTKGENTDDNLFVASQLTTMKPNLHNVTKTSDETKQPYKTRKFVKHLSILSNRLFKSL